MRTAFQTLFTALLVGLCIAEQSHSKPVKKASISTADVKAGYEHVAARYASWAERKKQRASNKSKMIFGQLKLAVAEAPEEAVTPPPKIRGTTMRLNAVGGYPKMLGQTYNAVVGMGTPPQYFNLTADTGSMLTWAVQASCKEADCPGATHKSTYDAAKSRTSKKLRADHEAYGDGEMDLMLFEDVVTLNTTVIKAATIGGATKTFEKDGSLDHDGLLGLGRKEIADPEPVLETKSKSDKEFVQMIAIDLGARPNVEIGGYDFVKYPKLVQIKVEGDDGWLLSQSSVTAQGAVATTPVDLLVDTGSSVSMLPASRMDAIMNRPGLKVQRTSSEPIVYSMPCDTKLNVQMILPDGTKVPVKDSDILMQSNDAKMPGCLSLLVGTTNPFLPAVAGTPMLKSIYTVLSRSDTGDWIGLAPLVQEGASESPTAA
ncbi:related to secreted aspartic protease 2 [Sporisorium reilianum SRZ2]|uniref:Related to secreted aspartic protease 2 n=1 Tax=Sporisorium reilianum (strain SRZ2) TaxID=999809 RepID=E6ZYI4_SPORE|nr:related to secreted aspartic protease 2 [Sporisorium reilianum SRZ2]